jgi:hypothetical protein
MEERKGLGQVRIGPKKEITEIHILPCDDTR